MCVCVITKETEQMTNLFLILYTLWWSWRGQRLNCDVSFMTFQSRMCQICFCHIHRWCVSFFCFVYLYVTCVMTCLSRREKKGRPRIFFHFFFEIHHDKVMKIKKIKILSHALHVHIRCIVVFFLNLLKLRLLLYNNSNDNNNMQHVSKWKQTNKTKHVLDLDVDDDDDICLIKSRIP